MGAGSLFEVEAGGVVGVGAVHVLTEKAADLLDVHDRLQVGRHVVVEGDGEVYVAGDVVDDITIASGPGAKEGVGVLGGDTRTDGGTEEGE